MVWKIIKDYPNYSINEYGQVKNIKRNIIKKNTLSKNGYYVCNLGRNNLKYIHRLIGHYFIPNPKNHTEIDHINRIKSDNRIENLRWCSRRENVINTGLRCDNKLKEKYISKRKGRNTYRVSIYKLGICKTFSTLDEAIKFRNDFTK